MIMGTGPPPMGKNGRFAIATVIRSKNYKRIVINTEFL